MRNQCPYFYNSFIFLFFIRGGFCGITEGQVAYIAHTNAGFLLKNGDKSPFYNLLNYAVFLKVFN